MLAIQYLRLRGQLELARHVRIRTYHLFRMKGMLYHACPVRFHYQHRGFADSQNNLSVCKADVLKTYQVVPLLVRLWTKRAVITSAATFTGFSFRLVDVRSD